MYWINSWRTLIVSIFVLKTQRDQIIEKALPPEMLSSQAPRGVRRFCLRFCDMSTADKRTF
jgi:hypothetical protein